MPLAHDQKYYYRHNGLIEPKSIDGINGLIEPASFCTQQVHLVHEVINWLQGKNLIFLYFLYKWWPIFSILKQYKNAIYKKYKKTCIPSH